MARGSLLLTVLGVLLVALPAGAQDGKPQVRVERGLVYDKVGDTELRLDLAMPAAGDGPFPAVVCVHGGGWVGPHCRGWRR